MYFCNMIMFLFCQEVFRKYTKIPNIPILDMCMYQFSCRKETYDSSPDTMDVLIRWQIIPIMMPKS